MVFDNIAKLLIIINYGLYIINFYKIVLPNGAFLLILEEEL